MQRNIRLVSHRRQLQKRRSQIVGTEKCQFLALYPRPDILGWVVRRLQLAHSCLRLYGGLEIIEHMIASQKKFLEIQRNQIECG